MRCLYGITSDQPFHKTSLGIMCVPCHDKVTNTVAESTTEAPPG